MFSGCSPGESRDQGRASKDGEWPVTAPPAHQGRRSPALAWVLPETWGCPVCPRSGPEGRKPPRRAPGRRPNLLPAHPGGAQAFPKAPATPSLPRRGKQKQGRGTGTSSPGSFAGAATEACALNDPNRVIPAKAGIHCADVSIGRGSAEYPDTSMDPGFRRGDGRGADNNGGCSVTGMTGRVSGERPATMEFALKRPHRARHLGESRNPLCRRFHRLRQRRTGGHVNGPRPSPG